MLNNQIKNDKKHICLSLSRSGTSYIDKCFIKSGLQSFHFPFQLYFNINSDILTRYSAFSDSPIPLIYKKLDKIYPNSKYIISIRNKKEWLSSMEWLFTHGKAKWWWHYNIRKYHSELYGTWKFHEKRFSIFHDGYHEHILEYFKQRRHQLFIFNLDEGLDSDQFCKFLDISFTKMPQLASNQRTNVSLRRRICYSFYESLSVNRTIDRYLHKKGFVRKLRELSNK